MRRISYGEAPAAGREWDAGTIWFRNGDGRQQAARCESVCPSLPWSPGCLTHVDGPRVDMQLARFSRELPRLFLCGHSIFAPGSPFAWRAVQPDCSAAARALSSMPFSAAPPFPSGSSGTVASRLPHMSSDIISSRVSIENRTMETAHRRNRQPPFQTNPRGEKSQVLSAWHTAHAALIANT